MPRGNFHRLKRSVLVLLVISAAAALAIWSARTHYEYHLAQQIWPLAAPDIYARSSSPDNSAPTVLLLGDSRMAQWDLPRWPGWRVVNAGAGGLTTGQLRLCAPKLLDEFHPDAVVLEAGVNDLKFIGLRPEMAPRIISLAADNLAAVVRECAARHCRVIVLETWPAGEPGRLRRLVWSAKIPAAIGSLNAQLRLLDSPGQGIRVVDLCSDAGLKPDASLYLDMLHFKPEVYQRLTPALEKELEAVRRGIPDTK